MSGGLWSQNATYGAWPARTSWPASAKNAASIVEFEPNCGYSGAGHRTNVVPTTHAIPAASIAHSKVVTGACRYGLRPRAGNKRRSGATSGPRTKIGTEDNSDGSSRGLIGSPPGPPDRASAWPRLP